MRTVLTKYGNTVGNNPAQIRDPRIRSGKHPNCSRSCSSSHFFLFPVFPAKTVYGRFIWYTVSVGTGISCSRLHPYLRGTAVGRLVGRCGFFESWAFRLWTATTWSVFFRARSSFICVLLFLKKGFSPLLGGALWLSPTQVVLGEAVSNGPTKQLLPQIASPPPMIPAL
jgi:hypothetical protein